MIGLLTGTFDPVHLGHVALAKAAMRECGLDEVWLLVNADPAHKTGVVPYEHRLAMAKLAVRDEAGISVYAGAFAESPHTMDTFANIMRQHPGDRFVFIVGMDTMARLDSWDDLETVVRGTSFAVVRREGTPAGEIDGLRRRLGKLGSELEARMFDFDGYTAASSKQIRERLRAGEQPEWLDARVAAYIVRTELYR